MAWNIITTQTYVAPGSVVTGAFPDPGPPGSPPGNVAGFVLDPKVSLPPSTGFLTNGGTINAVNPSPSLTATAYGVFAWSGDSKTWVVNERTGLIHVEAKDQAYGYLVDGFYGPSFINRGEVEVSADRARGVSSYATSGRYINEGSITVTGGMSAIGVAVVNSETDYTFENRGVIEVTGRDAATGVVVSGVGNSFVNKASAVIRAQSDSGRSYGAYIEFYDWRLGGHVNHGLIEADVAVYFWNEHSVRMYSFVNADTGVLRGDVELLGYSSGLTNSGLVEGDVFLGQFADAYEGLRDGRVTGMVSGGDGNDILLGASQFDYLHGNQGDDTLRGGGGGDWLVGGQGRDNVLGQEGHDVVLGNLGEDILDGGAGDDVVRGGQGNDSLTGGDGNDWLAGDRGDDTLAGGAGADIFHSFGDAQLDRILDFNASEGDRVSLLPGTTFTAVQTGGDVVLELSGGGRILIVGVQLSGLPEGWVFIG